jgi:DNA polymerase III delta subunit
MLMLDDDHISGESEAAQILGTAPFLARKSLDQSRRLGSARIAAAINLVAAADLNVKGGTGLSPEMVAEILVARLARQTRPARSGAGRR